MTLREHLHHQIDVLDAEQLAALDNTDRVPSLRSI